MPHYFNLLSADPLQWEVTDGNPKSGSMAHLQLTGRHMHAQPAAIQFEDGSVACAFFEPDRKLIALEQLHPDQRNLLHNEKAMHKIVQAAKRIPVPHIKRREENMQRLELLVEEGLPLSSFDV
jgi:hypothetical protein